MNLIGLMQKKKKPADFKKAYAYAVVAKAEGSEILFFSPNAVDLKNKKIDGYMYKDGEWINVRSEFPDVIYNAEKLPYYKKRTKIVNELKKEIPFTTYCIGNKMWVYNNLMKHGEFSKYVIPSEPVKSTENFFYFLDKYERFIFKPVDGRQGNGIYLIKKTKKKYEVLDNNELKKYNRKELTNFVNDKVSEQSYMVQPYIDCRTKSGIPYSLRLHVQKNYKGEWVVTQIYPSIGNEGNIVCNIWRGAYTKEIDPFLEGEFGNKHQSMKRKLELFSLQLAAHMGKIQKEQGRGELDELGIDVGLDDERNIYIYEVNSRPGSPPAFDLELDVVKNTIHYALFLANDEKRCIH